MLNPKTASWGSRPGRCLQTMPVEDVGRSWGACATSGRREKEMSLHRAALPQHWGHGLDTSQATAYVALLHGLCVEAARSRRRHGVWGAAF